MALSRHDAFPTVSQPWIDRVRARSAFRITRPPKNILAEEFRLALLLPSDDDAVFNERYEEFTTVTKADLAQKIFDDGPSSTDGGAFELLHQLVGIMFGKLWQGKISSYMAAGCDLPFKGGGRILWTLSRISRSGAFHGCTWLDC
jgi:hypothetical protein